MEYNGFIFSGEGKRHFGLSEDSIAVTRRRLTVTLLLKGLEPEYRTVRRRIPTFYIGLISFVLGLVFFVYGLIFNSEDMAEMRSRTSSEQAEVMFRRQVTVQVPGEEPLTGAVTTLYRGHGGPQLGINSKRYAVQDVTRVKADRAGLFALAFGCALPGLLILSFSWRKVEQVIFKNTTGIDGIGIGRAGPDSSNFDQFVDELSRRIRQAKGEEGQIVS